MSIFESDPPFLTPGPSVLMYTSSPPSAEVVLWTVTPPVVYWNIFICDTRESAEGANAPPALRPLACF